MRWTRKEIVDKKDNPIFYSCHKEKHILGTGLRVIKRIKHNIMNFKVKSRRFCSWGICDGYLIIASYAHMFQQKIWRT